MRFVVDIPPTGKARPRMTRSGHVYTPKGTIDAEKAIALAFRMYGGECIPKGVPVSLKVTAYFPVPKSFTKGQRQDIAKRRLFPTKKPDADNILKLVGDALNGVAYADDAQAVETICVKEYSLNGEAYMAIEVKEFTEESEGER